MLVKNLESWAGDNFSHAPGEIIDLPDEIALARIEAGLCAAIEPPAAAPDPNADKTGKGK